MGSEEEVAAAANPINLEFCRNEISHDSASGLVKRVLNMGVLLIEAGALGLHFIMEADIDEDSNGNSNEQWKTTAEVKQLWSHNLQEEEEEEMSCIWSSRILVSCVLMSALFFESVVSEVPAIFVFGDSILDTGNNNYFTTWSKCNFPPYGRNFLGAKPTGRFSDGKIISDLLAESLGIKNLLPPYLDPNIGAKDLLTGVAFASGGCGFDPETPKLLMALSMPDQVKHFQEYKQKLRGLVGYNETNKIVNNSLYLISSGNNDIGLTYFLSNRRLQYDMDLYAAFLVAQASESFNELYKLGARKIGVFSTLVSGCVPEARTLAGGKQRQCAENFNELARLYNKKLVDEINYLGNKLPDAKLVFVDLFTSLLNIIEDPKKYDQMACIWSSCILVSWILLLGALFLGSAVSEVPAIFVFGDSILDTGNNNYFTTFSKSNFPPYGRNFLGAKPTGRFSDGKIISDLLGVAFASGGCGFDPETSKLQNALSIADQLKLFQEYKENVREFVGFEETNKIVNDSLYLVSSGNNDIGLTYFLSNRMLQYDINSYATFLVTQASEFFNELFKLGARKIGVFSTLVSGCVPQARTLAGGKQRQCADSFNELARSYNTKLIHEINYLGNKLPDVKIAFLDLFTPLLDIIKDPQRYGFTVAKDGCCGTGKIEIAVLCNELLSSLTCINTSQYIFWDGVHPTEKAYQILVSRIEEYLVKQLL
ncbi:GDSL esterase/lipase At5g42170 [Linum grandiflorum]